VPHSYALLRKKPRAVYRQKFFWRVLPVPGVEARNPPVNHHGVDLTEIRNRMEINRESIRKGKVPFPGLGVPKHPLTIVTSAATYVAKWARRGGVRRISIVGGPPLPDGKILFLEMGQPMVITGACEMLCVTPPRNLH